MTKLTITKVPSVEDRSLPVFAEIDQLLEAVRGRAYELFEERGCATGRDLDDWLVAELELCGPEPEITEDETRFRLEVPVDGFEPSDLDVTATPYELVVRASRDGEERRALLRRVQLATPVEVEAVTAKLKDGRLILTATKAAKPAGKVVPVEAAA
jgi:HSP20 family molecular chaperone IbpA